MNKMHTNKNLQNILFITILLAILISPMVYWFSLNGNWNEDSILEERKLVSFPSLSFRDFKTAVKRIFQGLYDQAGELFFDKFLDGSFQNKMNTAASEQMLLRIPLVEISKMFERTVIKSAYLALPDQALPASFDSGLYITRDSSNLMQDPALFTQAEKEAVDLRLANYRDLLADYPDINLYVFNIDTLPYSPYHPVSPYFPQADNGQSLQYFLENKPSELRFENFPLTSFKEYQDHFFKTDQHWNIYAAMQAYQQIYQMLQENYPDISPMLQVESYKKVDGVEFLGSLARKSLFPIEADILEYVDVDMPDYSTYVNGELTNYGGRENYLKGIYNHDKYFNHYRGFYGSAQVTIQYHFENGSDRNLLMIVSSHSRTIQMYLASHYRDSYVIDMRYEENSSKTLGEYIDEYQITDVLILGQAMITYYSTDYAIIP